jgi:hypothetical protein
MRLFEISSMLEPAMTERPSEKPRTLRERLVGTWKLESYIEVAVDSGEVREPMGEQPIGLLLYTADGYMSAQLMRSGRRDFASGDWSEATVEEYRDEASTYIAYSGPYHVDEKAQALRHSMVVSLFPNWTGQTQARLVSIEKDRLHLSTAAPISRQGRLVMARLTWKRADTQ